MTFRLPNPSYHCAVSTSQTNPSSCNRWRRSARIGRLWFDAERSPIVQVDIHFLYVSEESGSDLRLLISFQIAEAFLPSRIVRVPRNRNGAIEQKKPEAQSIDFWAMPKLGHSHQKTSRIADHR